MNVKLNLSVWHREMCDKARAQNTCFTIHTRLRLWNREIKAVADENLSKMDLEKRAKWPLRT